MPRYHFHLVGRVRFIPDPDGVDLPDDTAARAIAESVITELGMGKLPNGEWEGWWLDIVRGEGASVAQIPLSRRGDPIMFNQ